ncbi:MAG TPA: hypothetical protein VGA56_06500 [Opitutaceae bacterium]
MLNFFPQPRFRKHEHIHATAEPKLEFSLQSILVEGLHSDVRAGENAGRSLDHEFVALSLQLVAMERLDTGPWSASLELPHRVSLPAKPSAVAAWVTREGGIEPLQAVGGWLARGLPHPD